MNRGAVAVLLATVAGLPAVASAEVRGTVRFGVMPLELESSADTPWFGDDVDRAVDRYNAAAAAYDRASGSMTARIDAGDLGVAETLFVIAPGFEAGAGAYFFRLEAPIGLGADLRSVGVGLYPLNLQARLRRGLAGYLSAGGTASYLDRPGPGDVGGLLSVRAAAGVRIADRMLVELGYNAVALGGTVNRDKLDGETITAEDMASPERVISAGEARGLIDISVGVSF